MAISGGRGANPEHERAVEYTLDRILEVLIEIRDNNAKNRDQILDAIGRLRR